MPAGVVLQQAVSAGSMAKGTQDDVRACRLGLGFPTKEVAGNPMHGQKASGGWQRGWRRQGVGVQQGGGCREEEQTATE